MASKNYLSGLFGASPVAPLQAHMTIVDECVTKLIDLFENMASGNTAEVEKIYLSLIHISEPTRPY